MRLCDWPDPLDDGLAHDTKDTAAEKMRAEAMIEFSKRVLDNFSEVDRNWSNYLDGGELYNFARQPENQPLMLAGFVLANQLECISSLGNEAFGQPEEASRADFQRFIDLKSEER